MEKLTYCWYCGAKIKLKTIKGKPIEIICRQCKIKNRGE